MFKCGLNRTYAVSFRKHTEDVPSSADCILNAFGVKEVDSTTNSIRMRVSLHLHHILGNSPEAEATMPSRICQHGFSILGMAVEAFIVPHARASAPTGEA